MNDVNITIYRTRDYSIFKKSKLNRETDKTHVKRVKLALEKENNLHLKPIIVNSEMEVMSGQHRLQAATEMGLEVFYMKDDKVSYEFILTDNSVQKSTTLKEVIAFWAAKESNENYLEIIKYMKITGLAPKSLLCLLFGSSEIKMSELLRTGKFMLPSDRFMINRLIQIYCRVHDFAKEKRITPISMFSNNRFASGFRNLVICADFDEETFFRKLENKWFDMRPQINVAEWTRHLLKIYNWKNHTPISEDVVL